MLDTISPVLDLIGVKGAIYFQSDFCAPWGMDISGTGFAQFHMVVAGDAVLRHEDGTQILLSSGDLVVYPTGVAHTISDSEESPMLAGQEVVGAVLEGRPVFAGDDEGAVAPILRRRTKVGFVRNAVIRRLVLTISWRTAALGKLSEFFCTRSEWPFSTQFDRSCTRIERPLWACLMISVSICKD